MSEALQAGGGLAYVVLLLGVVGIGLALAMAAMAATKRRVPLTALVAVPMFTLAIGAIAAWLQAGAAVDAIGSVEGAQVSAIAMNGMWESVNVDWLARWMAALALIAGAWAAALGPLLAAGE